MESFQIRQSFIFTTNNAYDLDGKFPLRTQQILKVGDKIVFIRKCHANKKTPFEWKMFSCSSLHKGGPSSKLQSAPPWQTAPILLPTFLCSSPLRNLQNHEILALGNKRQSHICSRLFPKIFRKPLEFWKKVYAFFT